MKRALKALLRKLEAIQEEYDGLGDTNVRDHMGDDVRRGFLQPEAGFAPSGEYGLEPEADRKVAKALAAFCKSASAAAQRLGLDTYEQRVAAFQDPGVTTESGCDFNDFFGVIELDPPGTEPKTPAKPNNAGKRGLAFDRPGTLEELRDALNAAGDWQWWAIRQFRAPFLESNPGYYLWVRISPAKRPATGFVAVVETEAEALISVDHLADQFRALLRAAQIDGVVDAVPK
jgi:hypothetical protein